MAQTYRGVIAFIFPSHIEHPDTTGRLELLGYLGPVTAEGKLYGGFLGRHEVQDQEITGMILQQVRQTCRKIFRRDTVVEEAVSKSFQSSRLTRTEVENILEPIPILDSGCLDFTRLQQVILTLHHQRISQIADQFSSKSLNIHTPLPKKNLFQYKRTPQYLRKQKKTRVADDVLGKLHAGAYSITAIDDIATTEALRANIQLTRPSRQLRDQWDPHFATRKTGQPDYVGVNGVRVVEYDDLGVL